jgi:alpha-D-xyloside xylohydrolase
MKFSDGFWLNKEGYKVHYATQNYEVKKDGDSILLFATGQFIGNRGQTLAGPVFEIRYSSPRRDIIKVQTAHYRGRLQLSPNFELYADETFTPEITETDGYFELKSGDTRVRVAKYGAYDTKYFYKDKELTRQGWRTTSYIEEDKKQVLDRRRNEEALPFWSQADDGDCVYMRDMFNITIGESIYGFGEKFSTFVKNGQSVDVWNADGGTCSEQAYKCIPFYLSSNGYGLFANHPERVMFEVGSETVSKVQFTVQGESTEFYLIGGEKLTDVLDNYTSLTGKPAMVPAWSFGLWLSTSFTTAYDEGTVTKFIDEMASRKIPLEVFHFDCFWMREFHWTDMTWDSRMFPEPAAMLQRLKAKGLKICVWINPYVGQQSCLFDEGAENDYFILDENGDVFQTDMWQPGLAIVDFTNPDATEWYKSKLRALLDMGVDCFKTDFGERIPTHVSYYDGSDPYKMHNYYAYIYNKAVFETIEEVKGAGQATVFARSATVGGQKFPVHWGGDCFSSYESMWEAIRGMLSLGLAGFGYASHDIGGFEATGSADLYKRWVAFGLLSSHSRLHGNNSYRVPWNYDEEACDVLRHFVNLKGQLMPYLYNMAVVAHERGIPMARAMLLEFQNDPVANKLDHQYMLGENLLVAPVFNDAGICEFYVPAGLWTDIQTGEVFEGGRYYSKTYDYFGLPLLARPNSIIPTGKFEGSFDYDYANGVILNIYQPQEGAIASCAIYGSDGVKKLSVTVTREGENVTVKAEGDAEFGVNLVSAEQDVLKLNVVK